MDKRHTFEDPKPPKTSSHSHTQSVYTHSTNSSSNNLDVISPDIPHNTAALSTQDWLDTLSRAQEIALSQSAITNASSSYSYSAGDDAFHQISSSVPTSHTHTNTLDAATLSDARSAGDPDGDRHRDPDRDRIRNRSERSERSGSGRATLQKYQHAYPAVPDRSLGAGVGANPSAGAGAGAGAADGDGDGDCVKPAGREGRSKRFSKRQSKGMLAAVF